MKTTDFTTCNVCDNPGTLATAKEIQEVYSNRRKFSDRKFTVWRCSSCGSLHSKEAVNLDEYYEGYLANRNLDYFLSSMYYSRLGVLSRYGFRKSSTLLDYGCNQGLFLSFLRKRRYINVFGYDPYIPEYADEIPLSKKYDFVVSYQVIEHVEEPRHFFEGAATCLKKGGILLIETPNALEIPLSESDSYLLNRKHVLHQPYHQHIISKQALLDLGLSQDLSVVQLSPKVEYDTLFPGVNNRAMSTYIRLAGDVIDIIEEPFQVKIFLTSPQLWLYCFAGYFFPLRGYMRGIFRNLSKN